MLPFLVIAVLFYYTAITETDVNKMTAQPGRHRQRRRVQVELAVHLPGRQKDADGQAVSTDRRRATTCRCWWCRSHETIRFVEHSPDVIHSFWVPELLFKRDVFPGNVTNPFEVTIVKQGAYVGRCAELCGTYHSMMNFELRAVTPDEYAAVPGRQAEPA